MSSHRGTVVASQHCRHTSRAPRRPRTTRERFSAVGHRDARGIGMGRRGAVLLGRVKGGRRPRASQVSRDSAPIMEDRRSLSQESCRLRRSRRHRQSSGTRNRRRIYLPGATGPRVARQRSAFFRQDSSFAARSTRVAAPWLHRRGTVAARRVRLGDLEPRGALFRHRPSRRAWHRYGQAGRRVAGEGEKGAFGGVHREYAGLAPIMEDGRLLSQESSHLLRSRRCARRPDQSVDFHILKSKTI